MSRGKRTDDVGEVVYDRVVLFTEKLARSYLGLDQFDGERAIAPTHVDKMEAKMRTGKFIPERTIISVALCDWDGKERKLDGQHTCEARLRMPENWAKKVRVQKYRVRDPDHYKLLYCQFNDEKPRSPQHKRSIYFSDSFGAASKAAKNAVGVALAFLMDPKRRTSIPVEDVAHTAIHQRADDIVTALPLVATIYTRRGRNLYGCYRKRGFVAAVIEVMAAAPDMGRNFFERLFGHVQQGLDDPVTKLYNYINRTMQEKTYKHDDLKLFNYVVACFNKFLRRKKLKGMPRVPTDELLQVEKGKR